MKLIFVKNLKNNFICKKIFEYLLIANYKDKSSTKSFIKDFTESVLIKFDDSKIAEKMSFLDKSGDSIRIKAHNVTFEGKKNTHITRLMFPFIWSWAITIHKTQGLSIDKAVISLSGCFAYNMEYMALSRFKTIKGLAILNLDLKRFHSNNFTNHYLN
jgi:hypothetical protein